MRILLFILIAALLTLQYRLWVGEGSIANVVNLQRQIVQQKAENERLKERNRLLAAEVQALKKGPEGVEERARSQMGMIKEGETFYMIVEENK